MDDRTDRVRAGDSTDPRGLGFPGPGRGRPALHPRLVHHHLARHPLLKEQFGRLHHGFGVEARLHPAAGQGVGDRHDGHALVVGHEGADDRIALPGGHA